MWYNVVMGIFKSKKEKKPKDYLSPEIIKRNLRYALYQRARGENSDGNGVSIGISAALKKTRLGKTKSQRISWNTSALQRNNQSVASISQVDLMKKNNSKADKTSFDGVRQKNNLLKFYQ